MNSTCRNESPWISLPWYPESWNSSVELWIPFCPGCKGLCLWEDFAYGEEPKFGVLGSVPLLLSSHWIVALEKFFWWLNTPQSLPGEHHCQPHPGLGVTELSGYT